MLHHHVHPSPHMYLQWSCGQSIQHHSKRKKPYEHSVIEMDSCCSHQRKVNLSEVLHYHMKSREANIQRHHWTVLLRQDQITLPLPQKKVPHFYRQEASWHLNPDTYTPPLLPRTHMHISAINFVHIQFIFWSSTQNCQSNKMHSKPWWIIHKLQATQWKQILVISIFNHTVPKLFSNTLNQPPSLYRKKQPSPMLKISKIREVWICICKFYLKTAPIKHSNSKRGKKATTYLRSSDDKQPTGVDMKGCFFIQILLWYHRSNNFGHHICTEVLKADFLRMLNRNHNCVHT